jgi:hypothetical protein
MARFPLTEAEILRLAKSVAAGLAASPQHFPSPPATAEQILAALADHTTAREEALAAQAQAVLTTARKRETLKALADLVKSDLRYAENHTRRNHVMLGSLGWGAPRPKAPLDAPGQVMGLTMLQELKDEVRLGWKPPRDGGPVAAYRVQRRIRGAGDWADVATAISPEIALTNQESGVELEYRVIALNKAGEGGPSNVARAVL